MAGDGTAGDGTAGPTSYGVLSLDGMQLALPLTVLREVIPAPPELTRLPAVAAGLLGAVELRDRVIPVVDLGLALGQLSVSGRGQVIAVAVHDGHVVGLLADQVQGITTVGPQALQAMTAQGGSLLFSHAFERPEDGTVCSLLDVPALFRMPGVPRLTDAGTGLGSDGGQGPSGMFEGDATQAVAGAAGRPVMMIRCGPFHLGLDAVDVHTVLPEVRLQHSPVQGGSCRGTTAFGARQIPVVDPLEVLGLGRLPDDEGRQGILLRFEQGFVALMLSEVIDIVSVPAETVLAVPPLAVRRPEFFVGVTSQPGGRQHLLLDVTRLLVEPDLIGLSACNTGPGTGPQASGPISGNSSSAPEAALAEAGFARAGGTYLTFSIGVDIATPLDQIAEIVPFAADRAVTAVGSGPVLGMMMHRRQALPVVDLAALLESRHPTDAATGSVLLVRSGGLQVGYLVQGLRAIETSIWEEDRDGDPVTRGAAGGLSGRPLLQLGPAGQERMVAFVDLLALCRDVFGDRATGDAGPTVQPLTGSLPGVPQQAAAAEQRAVLPLGRRG
jgi:purine-binding chemotaxis protein CheW